MVKLGSVRDVTALVTNEMPAPILARILEEANIPVILS